MNLYKWFTSHCLDTTQHQTNYILKDDASSSSIKEASPQCSTNVVIVNDLVHLKDEVTDNNQIYLKLCLS